MEINTVQLRQQITNQYQKDIESIDRMEALSHVALGAALGVELRPIAPGALMPRPMLTSDSSVRIKLKDQPQSNNHRGMHNAREACIRLAQPFRAADLARESGLKINGASTQLNRWLAKKLLVRVGPGLFKRVGDWPPSGGATGNGFRAKSASPITSATADYHAAWAKSAVPEDLKRRKAGKRESGNYHAACLRITQSEFGAEELAKASGSTVKQAGVAICALCKSGKIVRVGKGKYKLPGMGDQDRAVKSSEQSVVQTPSPEFIRRAKASAPATSQVNPGRISIPGLDGPPDYDNMSAHDLAEHLKKAIADKQQAEDAGQSRLFRILSDKVTMLQNKISAHK